MLQLHKQEYWRSVSRSAVYRRLCEALERLWENERNAVSRSVGHGSRLWESSSPWTGECRGRVLTGDTRQELKSIKLIYIYIYCTYIYSV